MIRYNNGNYSVEILEDGTKIRSINDGIVPAPEFPETIDIKITNYCNLNNICAYCHENSNRQGRHADKEWLIKLSQPSLRGMEWAIGGGNPLSAPFLIRELLRANQVNEIISNLTVNQLHVKKYEVEILELIRNRLIYGLGFSYRSPQLNDSVKKICLESDNVVWHIIIGVTPFSEILKLIENLGGKAKILLLGYKNFRNGATYLSAHGKQISQNIAETYRQLPKIFKNDIVVSFDNLAIEQLNVRRLFTDEGWGKFYMGTDGDYSMYIDAVNQTFAKTSTSHDIRNSKNKSISEMFNDLHCTRL